MRSLLTFFSSALVIATAAQAQTQAPVHVQDAWVRASVAQQKASGAFMRVHSTEETRLVGASSPVAGVTEVHEMTLENDVMRMRQVKGIDIAAGATLELKPGGYHIMLMNLQQPLTVGSSVALTLEFENRQGQRYQVPVQAPVRSLAGKAPEPQGHGHGHKH